MPVTQKEVVKLVKEAAQGQERGDLLLLVIRQPELWQTREAENVVGNLRAALREKGWYEGDASYEAPKYVTVEECMARSAAFEAGIARIRANLRELSELYADTPRRLASGARQQQAEEELDESSEEEEC